MRSQNELRKRRDSIAYDNLMREEERLIRRNILEQEQEAYRLSKQPKNQRKSRLLVNKAIYENSSDE